jgi:hypothetical protein
LANSNNVIVEWKDPVPGAAGYIVEWGTKPDDEFVPLGFFRPDQNTYTHSDLMWETDSYYRVRAIYGPASPEIEVTIPDEISDADYQRRFSQPEDYRWVAPKVIAEEKSAEKKSIRDASHAADAAPTNFKATLMPVTVSAFQLTWTDRASDEEGFFLEQKLPDNSAFEIVALLEPNVNSFGWALHYPHRKGLYRLRPYHLGKPSELLKLRTAPEPAAEKPAEPKP